MLWTFLLDLACWYYRLEPRAQDYKSLGNGGRYGMTSEFRQMPIRKRRSLLWDRLQELFGVDDDTVTERKRLGKWVNDLMTKRARPDDLSRITAAYRADKTLGKCICTPDAVLKHWGPLASELAKKIGRDAEREARAKERQARERQTDRVDYNRDRVKIVNLFNALTLDQQEELAALLRFESPPPGWYLALMIWRHQRKRAEKMASMEDGVL